jgi:hypothetical protein
MCVKEFIVGQSACASVCELCPIFSKHSKPTLGKHLDMGLRQNE